MDTTHERWTAGPHHVGLTVPDLQAALRFFVEGLGYSQVGAVPEYPAAFVSDGAGMITLWQAEDPASARPFDRRRNLGLHHLALRVREGALDALHERLRARGDVEIEFAPEPLRGGPTRHMMTRIAGGIRVEFIAPAQG
ncbi:VOC family protein [Nannocystis punicea]|uniref:VOC family protein n=1 Tax=Nannocystis punicea TaxID=2995304 RepID=A0ABY7GVA5_9BACT|nr:VOC family protein [Nannocystis poenicansa]WAS90850.1 VOC family protein [Nannocystis poenicansa]